jgi:hypothetical protein
MKPIKSILNVFILIMMISTPFYSQKYLKSGVYGFYINEIGNLPIGFSSFNFSFPLLMKNNYQFEAGIQIIGAATGVRGGYFAYGYFAESLFFTDKRFNLGLSTSLMAGGGAKAPDFDGWMVQSAIFSDIRLINNLKLRAGITYNHVSGSMIRGFSPVFGLNWDLKVKNDSLSKQNGLVWESIYTETAIGKFNKKRLAFIGVGASFKIGKYIKGDASIHALANKFGGYMQTLASIGPRIGSKTFGFSPSIILGLAGGGSAKTGGGGMYGYGFGLNYISTFHIGLKYQRVMAFDDVFNFSAVFMSIGKSINSSTENSIKWYPIMKVYGTNNGFGNIGTRFVLVDKKYVQFMGSTYWAFTDNKGAYAEGLFEISAHAPKYIPIYTVLSAGAGGGAGINKAKESLIYAASIGVNSIWRKFPFAFEYGYWSGGNIPKHSFSIVYLPKFRFL